jgi:hypothetical protein
VAVAVHPGYLPAVGPSPLRILPIVVPMTNVVVNAEEAPPKPSAPPPEPPAVKPVETNTVAKAAPVPPPAPAEAAPTNAPPVEHSVGDQVISPQMFLQYFNSGKVITSSKPLDFTPPQAASQAPPPASAQTTGSPGGSKSSYSTAPP